MITNITLENFKCFRQVSINPKLLTVLIGPNGTGKSSVLQALLLLKQSVGEEQIQFQGECVSLKEPSVISPAFLPESERFYIGIGGSTAWKEETIDYQYSARFSSSSGSLIYGFGGIKTYLQGREDYTLEVIADYYMPAPKIYLAALSAESQRSNKITEVANLPPGNSWSASYLSPDERIDLPKEFSDRLSEVLNTPGFVLQHLKTAPAIRGLVRPWYGLGNGRVKDVTLSAGFSEQEEETASNLVYFEDLQHRIAQLLTAVTGVGLSAQLKPGKSVEVSSQTPSGSVNIVAEGFGTNSLIIMFYQLISADKGATVLIEEPEIHLHPKAQAELAEVLAETAKAEDKQIIMTTHSEHLVERLLLLVAEGTLTADDLAIYSFSKDEQGECFATEIEVTENGQVEGGLTDFYANNLDTLDRRVKALKRSK